MAWIQFHHGSYRVAWRQDEKIVYSNPFTSKEQAEKFKLELSLRPPRSPRRISSSVPEAQFGHIIPHWLKRQGINPITRDSYQRSIFKPFLLEFSTRSIFDFSMEDAEQYCQNRRETVKGSTYGKEISILKFFFRWAERRFRLEVNPFELIRCRRIKKSPGLCLSYEQEWRLLQAATPYQRVKVLMARDTGIRAKTFRLLIRRNIDLDYKTLTFNILKKGEDDPREAETRTIPLTARLADELEKFRNQDPESYLFTYRGKPLSDPDKFLKKLRPKLGFHFRWHDLRHTFETRLWDASNREIAEYAIGHCFTYIHPSIVPEKIKAAFVEMEARTVAALEILQLEKMLGVPKEKLGRQGQL